MLSEPEVGYCATPTGKSDYPYVLVIAPASAVTVGDAGALGEWCANWCGQVEPVKLVGIITQPSVSYCICLYSNDNMPSSFGVGYSDPVPLLSDKNWLYGSGCVSGVRGGITGDNVYNCYTNNAYQCT